MFRVYSAAIEYIHDQSVRLLNAGATPDEIAKSVRLPPELAGHRYLSEFYGTAEWSARGVYERYIGWFGGDPVDLRPLEPRDRSDRYVRLAGGTRKILQTAEAAVKAGQFQWALELATHAYRAAGGRRDGGREWRAARDVRAKALRGLAGIERNPVARNYYLTALAEDYVDFRPAAEDQRRAVDAASAKLLFDLMKVRLIPDHLIGVNWTIVFHFTDTKQTFVLRLRHCVMRVEETAAYDGPMDAGVDTTLTTWKSVMTGRRNAFLAYFSGEIVVKGHLTTLLKFLSSFQKN
jgi:alkyl sulfatase BDS1-like metallo-beta-lactamase superfamily hydrolase